MRSSMVRIEPHLPQDTSYLIRLREAYEEHLADTTPTACGVIKREGRMVKVYRQDDGEGRVQIGGVGYHREQEWVWRSKIEISPRFVPDGPDESRPCVMETPTGIEFLFVTNNAYYKAPSSRGEPVDFFKAGETVKTYASWPNGWRRTRRGYWFDGAHATPNALPVWLRTTTDRLRLRGGPSTDTDVVYTFEDEGQMIGGFEFRPGWWRITPADFEPRAWVSADFIDIMPGGIAAQDVPKLFYLELLRPPPPVVVEAPPQPEPWRPKVSRAPLLPSLPEVSGRTVLLFFLLAFLVCWTIYTIRDRPENWNIAGVLSAVVLSLGILFWLAPWSLARSLIACFALVALYWGLYALLWIRYRSTPRLLEDEVIAATQERRQPRYSTPEEEI